jgi:formamidopyrimidine-DNA glycosylase
MPELPEVETIARALRPELVGATIVDADLRWPRTLAMPSARTFRRQIRGQLVEAVGRRAKFLTIQLKGFSLLIHLRMSGDLLVKKGRIVPEKHDRLILSLSNGRHLVFNDTRKFGRVWLTRDLGAVLQHLGPEPLEEAFTAHMLYTDLHARRRQLKPLLLDQSFLAGLGNIYTDEALHMAKLHPLRTSGGVTQEQAGALHRSIRRVLKEGIRRNGASIDWVYRGGDYQNHFRVYGREGQPCPVCKAAIRRIVVGQRGTHVCPTCQKLR